MALNKSRLVLLVDDNDADAELTLNAIAKLDPQARRIRVKDGADALAFVFREGAYRERVRELPALILLDLQMPNVGGIDVLQTLRSDELTQAIPVLVLTGSADEANLADATLLGAAGYLSKPLRVDELKKFWPP